MLNVGAGDNMNFVRTHFIFCGMLGLINFLLIGLLNDGYVLFSQDFVDLVPWWPRLTGAAVTALSAHFGLVLDSCRYRRRINADRNDCARLTALRRAQKP